MPIISWTQPSGSFSTAANWSTGQVPTVGYLDIDSDGVITATGIKISDQAIWLDYNQHVQVGLNLVNTTLTPTSLVVSTAIDNGVTMELSGDNKLDGWIVSENGPLIQTVSSGTTVNNGLIAAVGTSPTTSGRVTILNNATFQNAGIIDAQDNGSVSILFGASSASSVITNNGIIKVDAGGRLLIIPNEAGTVYNSGRIIVDGGTASIGASLFQTARGVTTISDNGSLNLGGGTDGGTIKIQSGMLRIATTLSYASPGPTAIGGFHSQVDFTGASGEISFGTTTISETFEAATKELMISAPWEGGTVQIADIHLGSARGYSASEFSAEGSAVLFHRAALA